MKHPFLKNQWKRGIGFCMSFAMAASLMPAVPAAAATYPVFAPLISETAKTRPNITKAGSIPASSDTLTYEQPFAPFTAGSENFRIPGLITLDNGDLLATGDARWEEWNDGGGIDSIASVSSDGGKTWNYSFPLYFPDSYGHAGSKATTIIDPGVISGPDGTVYFIADVNPTDCKTWGSTCGSGTGYVTVNGDRYLALTENFSKTWNNPPSDDNLSDYPYYVEHFNEEGYARILRREDSSETGYGVDQWYNIYAIENGEYVESLTQKQVNSDTDIQQNVFYKGSKFHVYRIDYLWLVKSTDYGRTWEPPVDITDQIKQKTGEQWCLVSPGKGISTSTGDIVIGFYHSGGGTELASMVYSTDNGETWKRTEDVKNGSSKSSENEIVELSDGTLRMFYRRNHGAISYADIVKNEDTGEYVMGSEVKTTVNGHGDCNVSALSYSQKINGKQVILVGCPTSGRAQGRIFVFLVDDEQEGNPMELYHTFVVPGGAQGFVYCCLTELLDGRIGFLWEPNHASMYYDVFDMGEILGNTVSVDITKGGPSYAKSYIDSKDVFDTIQGAAAGIASMETSTEERTAILHEHTAQVASSLDTYSNTVSENYYLEDAEFTFTAAGGSNLFTIYNEAEKQYLCNAAANNPMCSATHQNDMQVVQRVTAEGQEAFSICMNTGSRYIIFYAASGGNGVAMGFNTNSGWKDNDTAYHIVLLERKEAAADGDIVPGYQRASSVESGKKYLISYIWTDSNNKQHAIIMYPTGDYHTEAVLVGSEKKTAWRKTVKFSGTGSGSAKAVVDGITYDIHVTDPSIVLNPGDVYEIRDAAAVTAAPDNGAVISAAVYDTPETGLFDHKGNENSVSFSTDSFADAANSEISLDDAAFTFTGSGDTWQIKNGDKYLKCDVNWLNNFFTTTATNMKVEKQSGSDTFRIYRADYQKDSIENSNIQSWNNALMGYIVFYYREMDFRSYGTTTKAGQMGKENPYGLHAGYNLTLFEKTDSAPASSPLAGYQAVSSVTDGHEYLIAHVMEDGSVAVLYPAEGTAAQTKLAKREDKGVKITAIAAGDSNVTIDGTVYEVHVKACGADHSNAANVELRNKVEVSCTEASYTGDKVCKTCGKVIEKGKIVLAQGHDLAGEGTLKKKVSKTENGEIEYGCQRDGCAYKMTEIVSSGAYGRFLYEYETAGRLLQRESNKNSPEAVSDLQDKYQAAERVKNQPAGAIVNTNMVNAHHDALHTANQNLLTSWTKMANAFAAALPEAKVIHDAGEKTYYEASKWEAFEAAYDVAGNIDVETAAYTEVQEATENLNAAKKDLLLPAMQMLYEMNRYKEKGNYTDYTWTIFTNALHEAELLLKRDDASVSEMIQAMDALEAASNGLRALTEAKAPYISYVAPVAGNHPKNAEVSEGSKEDGHASEVTDRADNPAALVKASDDSVAFMQEDGRVGFNGQYKSGANDDKFDVSGDNPLIISFKLYLNKRANSGNNLGLVTKGDHQYAIQLTNTGLNFYLNPSGTGSWPTVSSSISDSQLGKWLNVLAVNDGKGMMRMYVDGSVSSGTTGTATLSHRDAPFAIGCRYNDSGNIDQKFTSEFGYLADVKFYSGADMTADMKTAINLEKLGSGAYMSIQNLISSVDPTAHFSAAPYTAQTVWSELDNPETELTKTDSFADDKVYQVKTTLTAIGDYEFLNSEEFINGVVKNVSTGLKNRPDVKANVVVSDDKKTMTVTVAYVEKPEETVVTLDPSADFSLKKGETRQIAATTEPEGAAITWTSSNDQVATVSETGLVTAVAKGTAIITATPENGKAKWVRVTVNISGTTEPDKKEELNAAVEAADKRLAELESNQEDYTPESVEAFKAAVANAKQALANANLTDEDLGKILEALKGVQPETKVEAAERQLTDEIGGAKTDAGNPNYTSASIQVLNRAIEKAETALREGATAEELKKLLKEIQTARENLAYITYTVTFDGNGGSPASSSVKVQIGKSLAHPAGTPARSGYDFLGWSTAKNGAVVKWPLPVTGDIILYAQWNQKAQPEQPPKFEDGAERKDVKTKMKYKVVSAKKQTVMVVQGTDKNAKSINIPATVKIDNKTWKIVTVGKDAFKGYAKATKLTLSKNVTAIEQNAFNGCRKLKTIMMKGKTIKSVKSGAFKNTSKNLTVKVPKSVKKAQKKKLQTMLRKKGNKKLVVK